MQVIDWQSIVNKHAAVVWQTAYRLLGNGADAADCFQETFVSAMEISRRQKVRNFPALLARLATTRAIDQLRRRVRRLQVISADADLSSVPSNNPGPAQQAQTQELAGRLRASISQLPPLESQVFCLRYLNDMSYRQIAKELGIKTNAAGVLLHRARAKLRQALEPSSRDNRDKSEVIL